MTPLINHLPYAVSVNGKTIDKLPQGVYIPDNPLKIMIEDFIGPLDLLLYLIRKNKINILQLPIAEIIKQYNKFIDIMEEMQFEKIADYLAMSAWLTEIKSRLLNPLHTIENTDDENNPQLELSQILLMYEAYQKASIWLNKNQLVDRDIMLPEVSLQKFIPNAKKPEIHINQLLESLEALLMRQFHSQTLQIEQIATIEIEHKIQLILQQLTRHRTPVAFYTLCIKEEEKMGVIVTFLAVLELIFETKISLIVDKMNEISLVLT